MNLKLLSERTQGIELPGFKSDEMLFVSWSIPMNESGHFWIAFGRSHRYRPYDLLYIDSNGNGHLDDETVAAVYRTDQYNAYLGPVKVIFEVEDGLITYHLNFRFCNFRDRGRLYASSGGRYEGYITVG